MAMIRRTTASRRCSGEICHAMSKAIRNLAEHRQDFRRFDFARLVVASSGKGNRPDGVLLPHHQLCALDRQASVGAFDCLSW